MAVQFLIVDDDFGPRKGLAQTLGDFYPEAELLQASSVAAAIAVLTEQPNLTLVLLDLNVEDSRGMQTLRISRIGAKRTTAIRASSSCPRRRTTTSP